MNLQDMKNQIENFSKNHQIEVLKIIKHTSTTTINENKSGIYINLTFLPEDTITQLRKYIEYVKDQESVLTPFECQKQTLKHEFFVENSIEPTLYNM
jgi:hypothetical protein